MILLNKDEESENVDEQNDLISMGDIDVQVDKIRQRLSEPQL